MNPVPGFHHSATGRPPSRDGPAELRVPLFGGVDPAVGRGSVPGMPAVSPAGPDHPAISPEGGSSPKERPARRRVRRG
ncbi:hypothetical protein SAM23877_6684 [Streptomyces ambofaciens ATCC 23877]|uniref:Uncharacterized protein n=1 Tax=Streptomyces ambofaciens (strain ATCC 23877 / 3486 / DSM 40053 / JCM 4204 / NBRC 12836 / NRRL B-2516) TaxID=278992 RepID=A0A0K2B389_STRA7|nr:hypothetical protein SAM23877_6684 [Streptomyces ambofaciens ATCC 23877]